jgi:hypothetical protein
MPARFTCPGCGAVPERADDLPPGKRIKCAECGTVYSAPADDEDEDERPSRRGRRRDRQPQGGSGALVVLLLALVLVGVLVVAGGGAAACWLWLRASKPVANGPIPPPPFPQQVPQFPPVRQGPMGQQPGGQAGVGIQVGMTAPEIEGEDIDGKKFKLSDYRGKVVLLDFWGNW